MSGDRGGLSAPGHRDLIAPRPLQRGRRQLKHEAWEALHDHDGGLGSNRSGERCAQLNGVADHDRYANARRRHRQVGDLENLARLADQL